MHVLLTDGVFQNPLIINAINVLGGLLGEIKFKARLGVWFKKKEAM